MAKTIEGKSRLVCLAYQVLSKIDVIVSGKTDGELMAVLVAAFHQHAAEIAKPESGQRPDTRCMPPLQEACAYPLSRVADRGSARSNGPDLSAGMYGLPWGSVRPLQGDLARAAIG
jgi:hypothetical protein